MPILPDPGQSNRLGLQPSRAVPTLRTGAVERATAGAAETERRAAGGLADSVTRFGSAIERRNAEIDRMAEAERRRLDAVKVEAARNGLRWGITELTVGPEGYIAKGQGGNVLDKAYLAKYTKSYDQAVDSYRATLSTPEQKAEFESTAATDRLTYTNGLLTHTLRETDKYETTVYANRLASNVAAAAAQYRNPKATEGAVGDVLSATVAEMDKQGVLDPTLRDATVRNNTGAVYASAALKAVSDGDVAFAQAYLQEHKGHMTPEQAAQVEAKLKPTADFASGKALGLQAYEMRKAGVSRSEVEVFLTVNAPSPGAYSTAQSVATQFQQADREEEAETSGVVYEAFSLGGATRKVMNDLLGSREYLDLSDKQQGELAKYMTQHVKATEAEGRGAADRAATKQANSPEAYSLFADTITKPDFISMTPAQIYALAPQIGPALTGKLVVEHKALKQGVAKFAIDKDILNEAIPPELLQSKNKDKLNTFRGITESALAEFKTKNPGKIPTADEQKGIARSALKEYTEVRDYWFDKTYKLYEVTPKIRASWDAQLVAAAAAKGKKLTPAQIERAWQLKIQKGS